MPLGLLVKVLPLTPEKPMADTVEIDIVLWEALRMDPQDRVLMDFTNQHLLILVQ